MSLFEWPGAILPQDLDLARCQVIRSVNSCEATSGGRPVRSVLPANPGRHLVATLIGALALATEGHAHADLGRAL
jgi:hypothetical protein